MANEIMAPEGTTAAAALARDNLRLRAQLEELKKENATLRKYVKNAKSREWERLDRQRQADRAHERARKRRRRRARVLLALAMTLANIWRMAA